MKKGLLFLLLIAAFGCKKGSQDYLRLRKVESTYGLANSYEYNDQGKLIKENSYMGFACSSPVDEYTYVYANGKLDKLQIRMRSLYSSTMTICNPASGINSEEQYEYDSRGRILKVSRSASYTVFVYDNRNRVMKHVLYVPGGAAYDSVVYDYDARGNIISQTDGQNRVTNYTYDNKINPFYLIGTKPGWISPYNSSPNNVLKSTGALGAFERKILKYTFDMPSIIEENGVKYTYSYQ